MNIDAIYIVCDVELPQRKKYDRRCLRRWVLDILQQAPHTLAGIRTRLLANEKPFLFYRELEAELLSMQEAGLIRRTPGGLWQPLVPPRKRKYRKPYHHVR